MAYPRENYEKVKKLLLQRRAQSTQRYEEHKRRICAEHAEFAAIEYTLSSTGIRIYNEAKKGAEGLAERIEQLRLENERLIAKRTELLLQYGYPADYLDIVHECNICNDEGNVNGSMCVCMRRELILLGFQSAGIGHLIAEQSFDTFDLSYYTTDAETYKCMRHTLERCKEYAEKFNGQNDASLFFIGGTGLGKTHLCTSIAKKVVENGFDVVYETSSNVFSDFESEKFNRGMRGDREVSTERYFATDLLIIDDLGTESVSQFTVSALYNLINSRKNSGKATIINSNLPSDELMKKYDQRIYSRLVGGYELCRFVGKDIRMQKLKGK